MGAHSAWFVYWDFGIWDFGMGYIFSEFGWDTMGEQQSSSFEFVDINVFSAIAGHPRH
jgi:hypothetical protein